MVLSIMVPAKGREQFAVDRAVSFIEEIGFLHQDLIVKSDQESVVRAVVEEVGKARAALGSEKWIVEHSPVRSSQSNGVVERAVQSVQGQLRVMKLAIGYRWNVTIPSSHPLLAWAVEYAGVLLNRFEVGHDGRTASLVMTASISQGTTGASWRKTGRSECKSQFPPRLPAGSARGRA